MKVCILSSGSKGNSTYIETNESKILIDLGTTSLYVENALKEIGVNPKDIDLILLTHTHTDHMAGLKVFIKKYSPKLFLTQKMYEDIKNDINIDNCSFIDKPFYYKDAHIDFIKTSHDVSDSNGYIVESNDKSVVYITDTGYINYRNEEKLKNRTFYIMESNHDVEMLKNGNYPFYLQQRILSDSGHLSNEECARYLVKYIGEKTKEIYLAHLSDENNDPDKALNTVRGILEEYDIHFNNIHIAHQKERTNLIEI